MQPSIFNNGSIKKEYKFEKTLGKGSFAKVKKAVRKSTHEEVAVKIINKTAMDETE